MIQKIKRDKLNRIVAVYRRQYNHNANFSNTLKTQGTVLLK